MAMTTAEAMNSVTAPAAIKAAPWPTITPMLAMPKAWARGVNGERGPHVNQRDRHSPGAHGLAMRRSSAYTSPVSKQSMQEPTFLIMTALAAGAQHGYGIMTDVTRISDGRVRLRAGTLYAALDRLKADGLVATDREEVVDGRLRRYYRITEEGTELLTAEVRRLRANAAAAAFRLGLAGGAA